MFCKVHVLDDFLNSKKEAFDLFIGSISFEERCLGSLIKLNKARQNIKQIYYFDYLYLLPIAGVRGFGEIEKNRTKRIKLQQNNKRIITNISSREVNFVSLKINNPLSDIVDCSENFFNNEIDQIEDAEKICIDISTFTKPFFFLILKSIIKSFDKKNIFVINTTPSSYSLSSLSSNIWGTEIMPGYNGTWKSQNKNILIALLGFESHKLFSILNKFPFSGGIIPIIGFPGYFPGLQDRALSENAGLLREFNVLDSVIYSPSSDPIECYKIMEKKFNDVCDTYNVAIAPIGPKPMALAASLLSIKYDIRIVYAFPQEYDPYYSQGIGKSYLYEVRLE